MRYVLRQCLRLPKQPQWQPIAQYQNFVMNDTLAQLESECERYCPVPRFPPRKVAVIGAGSDVGRIVSLFLKQQKVVKILAMYDDHPCRNVIGVANDIAHIDTSTSVEAYQGRMYLKDALDDADVVLICGGNYLLPPCCNTLDRNLFFENMSFVRTVTIAAAQFAPNAIIAVQTPPVDANFALVRHTLKVAKKFDKRKVLGVNSVNAMRANQLFCSIEGCDPSKTSLPVICGCGRCTRVPCFSASAKKARKFKMETHADHLTRLVREADELICTVKSNNEQGHLSIGFATARCVTCLMKGLFESPTMIDSALVQQASPQSCYGLKYCATPITVGKGGITTYMVPQLSPYEENLLEASKCDLLDMLSLGKCYATGDDYYLHPCRMYPVQCLPPCEVATPCGEKKSSKN